MITVIKRSVVMIIGDIKMIGTITDKMTMMIKDKTLITGIFLSNSIKSTPFRLAIGPEAVMPIEFQILTLRVQATERLDELQSEQSRKTTLLLLEEERIQAMAALEQKQR